jgi:thiol-disulfide isomerase/thioredoxin
MKQYGKDIKFLYWTLVGSLFFMAFLHILNPLIQPPAPDMPPQEKIEAVTRQIVTMRASEVAPLLRPQNQKNTFVFVYASWCAYCRQVMPDLVDLSRRGDLSHVNLLFLSIDNRQLKLATYIAQYGYQDSFTPYMVKGSAVNSLENVLSATGATYRGAIPYMAVVSPAGRVLGEEIGLVTSSRIRDLASLRADAQ